MAATSPAGRPPITEHETSTRPMRSARIATVASLAVASLGCGTAGRAQNPQNAQNTRSQLGTVTQQVAGARIEIVYRRPVAEPSDLAEHLSIPRVVRSTSRHLLAQMLQLTPTERC